MHLTLAHVVIVTLCVAIIFASLWIPTKRAQRCPSCGCQRFDLLRNEKGQAMWCRNCGQVMRP